MDFILIPLVLGLGGVVQGATGFGFGLTVVAILGAFSDPKEASIVVAVAAIFLNATVLWKLRRHIRVQGVLPLMACSVIGIPLGVRFLANSDPALFSGLLGVVLLVAVLKDFIPHLEDRPWHPVWVGMPMGMLSGLLSGAFGTGGPPVVAYVASQGYGRFRYVTTVQVILATNCLFRGEELIRQGLMTQRLFLLSLAGTVCVVVGSLLGLRILRWFSDKALRRVVSVILLILALRCFASLLF